MVSPNAHRTKQHAVQAQRKNQSQLERGARTLLPEAQEEAFAVADRVQANLEEREKRRQQDVQERHEQNLKVFRSTARPVVQGELRDRLRHPDDVELNTCLRDAVRTIDDSFRPVKTANAIDPKTEEYYQFCRHVYSGDIYCYIVEPDKVYRFFFYQAFRMKRNVATEIDPDNPEGKRKRKKRDKGIYFDPKEYKEIMKVYSTREDKFPIPEHPMSVQSFEQYKAAVKAIHSLQLERKANGLAWEMIWTATCKKLHKLVKDRAPLLKKLNYLVTRNLQRTQLWRGIETLSTSFGRIRAVVQRGGQF